jgi:hypothetical protein
MPAIVGWALPYTSGSAVLGLGVGVGMIVRHSAGAVSGILVWCFGSARHREGVHHRPLSSVRSVRRSRSELPTTDSELAVMATTPIMGCSSPAAAMGMAAAL